MNKQDEGFIITGDEGIALFQALRVAAALALEINTGMRNSGGSVMLLARSYCGSGKQTKRGVLKDYVAWLETVIPDYVPNPSVAKALGK